MTWIGEYKFYFIIFSSIFSHTLICWSYFVCLDKSYYWFIYFYFCRIPI